MQDSILNKIGNQIIYTARLSLAPPEVVECELKKLSKLLKEDEFRRDVFLGIEENHEELLLQRQNKFIDLALAQYGFNINALKSLYENSLKNNSFYDRGIRLAILANETGRVGNFLTEYPQAVIGSEEVERLLYSGSDREVEALLKNPTIDESILINFFKSIGFFENMPSERWEYLLQYASKNTRIFTEIRNESYPDIEGHRIQKAIFLH